MSRPRKKNSITPSVATIRVTHKYRAYPTVLQGYTMENWLFILCSVYNHAIEERAEGYKNTGKSISYSAQQNALPVLRKADPALRKVHSQVLQDCLQRVDKALRGPEAEERRGKDQGRLSQEEEIGEISVPYLSPSLDEIQRSTDRNHKDSFW